MHSERVFAAVGRETKRRREKKMGGENVIRDSLLFFSLDLIHANLTQNIAGRLPGRKEGRQAGLATAGSPGWVILVYRLIQTN